ncbi:MAG TPA: hypothetical protein VG322_02710 [Candidatus Acidoferrales bacterium]|jgi:hypothetical protein|nr:hypothetical protein [Candidatus Acidoferrales bacterium]
MLPGDSVNYEEKSRFPIAFLAGVVVVAILGVILFFVVKSTQPKGIAAAKNLPFGAQEQAYAPRIQFTGIQMAHSTNFLNQEFTFVAGTIVNSGDKAIVALQVVIDFHDQFNQSVLRDSEVVLQPPVAPLPAGQMRDFQVILERIPSDWNRQYPSIRVSGLVLQ